jgi:hypothetical protein
MPSPSTESLHLGFCANELASSYCGRFSKAHVKLTRLPRVHETPYA